MADIRNLVFEGGGVKGIAYGGALEELGKRGILEKIEKVAGTSAGAITATLVACGYGEKVVSEIIAKVNFNDFADNDWGILRDLWRLLKRFGWNKGNKFLDWIGDLIKEKTGNPDTTFRELHALAVGSTFRDLYLVGSNLSSGKAEVYSFETTPEMKIKDAARISMSFPLFFQAVRKIGDRIEYKKRKGNVMVDGGMTWNYPLDVFDTKGHFPPESKNFVKDSKEKLFNPHTLGFRLGTRQEHTGYKTRTIGNIKDYGNAMVHFALSTANKIHLSNDDWKRTVFIETAEVSVLEFDVSQEKIDKLLKNGRQGVTEYLEWLEKEEKKSAEKAS